MFSRMRNFGARDRALFGKMARGAGMAGSFLGGSALGLLGATGRLGMHGISSFAYDMFSPSGFLREGLREGHSRARRSRRIADKLEGRIKTRATAMGPHRRPSDYTSNREQAIADRWGRKYDPKTGRFGDRRFAARSVGEHLGKGARNIGRSLISPAFWGINLGIAAVMSGDNFLDPKNGIAKHMAENVGAEIGFLGGSTAAASLAALLIPGGGWVALAIKGAAFLAGGMAGAEGGAGLASIPWKLSEFGSKYGRHAKTRRSTFIDSEQAMTMRQRSMQMIYRSMSSARTALGSEAMGLHQ